MSCVAYRLRGVKDSGSRRKAVITRLFQKYVDRRVGNAQFLTGTGLVAAVAGRGAAGRPHADDRLRLGEDARSFVRFGVEHKPGNGLVDWCRQARLHLADDLAAVKTFPGRSGIVLADGLVLLIEQLCVRSPEDPACGARWIAAAGIDLPALRRYHAKGRQLVRIERDGHLDDAIHSAGTVRDGQEKGSGREHRGETGQTDEARKCGHRSLLFRRKMTAPRYRSISAIGNRVTAVMRQGT